MSEISRLSWNETSVYSKINLVLLARNRHDRKLRSEDKNIRADSYSEISSVYYSVVSTSIARLKNIFKCQLAIVLAPIMFLLWLVFWFPLTFLCVIGMLRESNKIVELMTYEGMNANHCDIRQSILRCFGKNDEAIKCIKIGLSKTNISLCTTGLLYLGLANIYGKQKKLDKAKECLKSVTNIMPQIEKENIIQSVRIYRRIVQITKKYKFVTLLNIEEMNLQAKQKASKLDLMDQIIKWN